MTKSQIPMSERGRRGRRQKLSALALCLAAFLVLPGCVKKIVPPDPAQDQFAAQLDLSPLRTIAVQHNQTVKSLDSYAREVLAQITGHSSIDGKDPVYTLLDLCYRPEVYHSLPIVKIANLPLRTEVRLLPTITDDEKERIIHDGTVSYDFVAQQETLQLFKKVTAADNRKQAAFEQLGMACQSLSDLGSSGMFSGAGFIYPANVVPPTTSESKWAAIADTIGNDPDWVAELVKLKVTQQPPKVANLSTAQIKPVTTAATDLFVAWRKKDAPGVNSAAKQLAAALRAINPDAYPADAKLHAEVVYNKLAKMTLPGAAAYFFALVLFLVASYSGLQSTRLWGLRLLAVALLIHTAGIAIRWWLVGTIPIRNEFESVMFSAWFGVVVGMLLELKFGKNIFGAGATFVGWLALIALFTVPYVLNKSIGQDVEQVNGVLMSYWLYIHVTLVTASYALIGMAFCLSVWWLVQYYSTGGSNDYTANEVSGNASGFEPVYGGSGSAVVMSPWTTLARMTFFPVAQPIAAVTPIAIERPESKLASLDACNLVVLQMAFWVLGAGIICGAIWADESWGRPWGWDPKETFALVTWIVYLVTVHVRFATPNKAWWTATLGVIGFGVMLFNWIGVNYFLPGLHSYAG